MLIEKALNRKKLGAFLLPKRAKQDNDGVA